MHVRNDELLESNRKCAPSNDWRDWAINGILFRPRPQVQSLYPHGKKNCTSSPRSHGQDSSTQRCDRKPSKMFALTTDIIAENFLEVSERDQYSCDLIGRCGTTHSHCIFEDRAPLFCNCMQRIVFRLLSCSHFLSVSVRSRKEYMLNGS